MATHHLALDVSPTARMMPATLAADRRRMIAQRNRLTVVIRSCGSCKRSVRRCRSSGPRLIVALNAQAAQVARTAGGLTAGQGLDRGGDFRGDLVGDGLQLRFAGYLHQQLRIHRFHQDPAFVAGIGAHHDIAGQ